MYIYIGGLKNGTLRADLMTNWNWGKYLSLIALQNDAAKNSLGVRRRHWRLAQVRQATPSPTVSLSHRLSTGLSHQRPTLSSGLKHLSGHPKVVRQLSGLRGKALIQKNARSHLRKICPLSPGIKLKANSLMMSIISVVELTLALIVARLGTSFLSVPNLSLDVLRVCWDHQFPSHDLLFQNCFLL